MGIFDTSKPHVSKDEFKKAEGHLHGSGFSDSDLHDVEEIFRSNIMSKTDSNKLTKEHLEEGIKWMKENKKDHNLSDHQIDQLHEALKKRI